MSYKTGDLSKQPQALLRQINFKIRAQLIDVQQFHAKVRADDSLRFKQGLEVPGSDVRAEFF